MFRSRLASVGQGALCLILLAACAPSTPAPTLQLATLHSTYAAEPWLDEAYQCAATSGAALSRVADPAAAQVRLRLGEPDLLVTPAFEIDSVEIVIAAHRETVVPDLNLDAARALFAGQGDPSVQVWVYDADADLQQVFDRLVMQGRGVSATARIAAGPRQVVEALETDRSAVGILPVAWSMQPDGSSALYSLGRVPVLAMTPDEPQGVIELLIGCLQQD